MGSILTAADVTYVDMDMFLRVSHRFLCPIMPIDDNRTHSMFSEEKVNTLSAIKNR